MATPGRFAAYIPRAVPPASGTSWTLTRYTLPLRVKNSSRWWVVVVKTSLITSSSLSVAPFTPLPPRPCGLEGVDRVALHVAGAADRDHHVLLGDQVLDVEVALVGADRGSGAGRRTSS